MRPRLPLMRFSAVCPWNPCFYRTGLCWRGQTRWAARRHQRTAKGTLLFCALGLTNVRQKTWMRRAKLAVIRARLVQAQLAVHCQSNFRRILIFLPIIFPPADRAQLQGARRFERLISATRAAITDFDRSAHIGIDGRMGATDYELREPICRFHGFIVSFLATASEIPKMSRAC